MYIYLNKTKDIYLIYKNYIESLKKCKYKEIF
jgi:hypothetical protein